jgi:flavin reductase (DIM6/NTAB) family NADH-FMN oxidoreductase RutF
MENSTGRAREFRDTMGLFATGVAVIAVQASDEVHAMTANAVSSLSLEPMLLVFCPAKKARLSKHLATGVAFSVNLLRAEQQAISSFFAGGWRETLPPSYRFVHMGAAPRLEGCLASLLCSVRSIVDGGDHWLVIGEVLEMQRGGAPLEPLLFYRGRYGQIDASASGAAPDLGGVTDEPAHIHFDT